MLAQQLGKRKKRLQGFALGFKSPREGLAAATALQWTAAACPSIRPFASKQKAKRTAWGGSQNRVGGTVTMDRRSENFPQKAVGGSDAPCSSNGTGGSFRLACTAAPNPLKQLEERLARARGQVEKITPSLLAPAFAGQLVPQEPTDEPAEKLLENIRIQSPKER